MRRLEILLLALAGCGRFGFGFGDTDAATGDATPLDAATRCAWDPVPAFGPVEAITSVNTPVYDGDPTLSRDGLTLFYFDGNGLHMAQRATPDGTFGPREEIPTMVPFGSDNGFFLTASGIDALLAVQTMPGNYDICTATRSDPAAPFGAPVPVSSLDTPGHEFNARLSPDEQWLIFLRWVVPGDVTTARLFMARRQGTAWTDIQRVFPSSTELEEAGSFVSDSLHIVFARGADLYTASRPTESDPFGAPVPIVGMGDISTTDSEELPFARIDGCELLFVSYRASGAGGNDLYRAIATP